MSFKRGLTKRGLTEGWREDERIDGNRRLEGGGFDSWADERWGRGDPGVVRDRAPARERAA